MLICGAPLVKIVGEKGNRAEEERVAEERAEEERAEEEKAVEEKSNRRK